MGVRVAFLGFNATCARLVESLAAEDDVSIAGIVAQEIPPGWPESLKPPALYDDYTALIEAARPDILLAAEPEIPASVPGGCQVMSVAEGMPAQQLLSALSHGHDLLKLEGEIREVAALCANSNVIEAYSDPQPKLTQLLDRAMAISGADMGMVLLPGEVLDELGVIMARGRGMEKLIGRGMGINESLCGRAFDEGEAGQYEVAEGCEESGYLEGSDVERLLAIPMRAEGKVVGVFALGRSGGKGFDSLHISLLTLIADQAGLAVQISRLYSELETNVAIDSASGLYNQSHFQQRLREETNRARRYSLNLCLVMLEIDGYRSYVERNGRQMGDLILSDVGNVIRRNTREVDVAARRGESQFAILLPETRRLGGMRLAERIRKVVEEYPFPSRERKEVESMTICLGLSSFPASAENDRDLLDKALAALAVAQAAGPNNIRLFSADLDAQPGSLG